MSNAGEDAKMIEKKVNNQIRLKFNLPALLVTEDLFTFETENNSIGSETNLSVTFVLSLVILVIF